MALDFVNISDESMGVADSASVQLPSTEITVCGWAQNTGGSDNFAAIIGKIFATSDPWESYVIQQDSATAGAYVFQVSDGNAGGLKGTVATTALAADTWFFYAGRWKSGEVIELRIYNADMSINQTVASAATVTLTIGYSGSDLAFSKNEGTAHHDGRLAHWAAWDVKLEWGEAKMFGIGRAVRPGNLAWMFEFYNASTTQPDLSGNGNNGTITGTPTQAAHAPIGRYVAMPQYRPQIVVAGAPAASPALLQTPHKTFNRYAVTR